MNQRMENNPTRAASSETPALTLQGLLTKLAAKEARNHQRRTERFLADLNEAGALTKGT